MLIKRLGKESRRFTKLIHFKATCPNCGCVALLDEDDVFSVSDLKLRSTCHYICPGCKRAVVSKALVLGKLKYLIVTGVWRKEI
jgi:uncharacterized protein YlaI